MVTFDIHNENIGKIWCSVGLQNFSAEKNVIQCWDDNIIITMMTVE